MTISPERFAAYQKIRADGANPSSALERLRIQECGPVKRSLPELPEGWTFSFSMPVDEDSDLYWLGEPTDKPKGFAFRRGRPRGDGTFALDRGEYAWFRPGASIETSRTWYHDHGYARHEAWLRALADARHSWELWEEYASGARSLFVLICKVHVHGLLMGSANLGGLDDSCDVEEERADLAEEALAEAKEAVAAFCAKVCPQTPSHPERTSP